MKELAAFLRRDLRRTLREPAAAILLLLFPVALGAVFALAFGGASGPPKIRLLLAIEDEGYLAQFLSSAVERPEFRERFEATVVDSAEGRVRLDQNEASALLVFPKGFSRAVLNGDSTTISTWKNPRGAVLPQVVEEGALVLADGFAVAGHVLGEPLEELRRATEGTGAPDPAEIGRVAAAMTQTLSGPGRFLFPPVARLETADDDPGSGDDSGAGQIFLLLLPGFAVMALVMIADASMRDLLRDVARGTLARALASPLRPATIVRARIVYTVILGLLGIALLSLFGAPFVKRKVDLAAFAALSLAFSLAAGGFAALAYGLARSERQGAIVGSMVLLVMSFLGGSWIPLSSLPPGMRALSPFTLNFWGVDAFGRVLRDGAGIAGVALHLGVLLAIFLVAAGLGSALLERRVQRGLR